MAKFKVTGERKAPNELIPAGEYRAKIIDAEFGYQGGGGVTAGSPNAKITFKIKDHPGSKIVDRIIFHPKTEWKAEALATAFGVVGPNDIGEEFDLDEDALVGAKGRVKVGVEEYEKNGKKNQANRIEFYVIPDDLPSRPKPKAPVVVDVEGDDVPF